MDVLPDVETAAAEAAAAVEALMSPNLPASERQRIYELCEQVKESPLALQCGLCLSAPARPNIVRYFGLQIVENTIKFHWNELPVDKKVFLKDACLELMASVDAAAPAHMRDALCRPLVEMVKREWPQQYAEFVPDMSRLAARGPLHTELVLRVFLRLAEDVATFQTLEVTTRRREVYRGLVACMDTVFGLLTGTLTSCVSAPAGQDEPLAQMCLTTLACYLEWAAVQHVMGDTLLSLLVRLLRRPGLGPLAAECLAVLFCRHGRAEDREPLLVVFEPGPAALLGEQVLWCCEQPPSDTILATLRLLAQALVGAVSQLTYCWGRAELTVQEPAGLAAFVALLLRLSEHACAAAADLLLPAWTQLLRHKQARQAAPLLAAVPSLFACLQSRARRPDDPLADAWRRLELDADEETAAGQRVRPELTEALRALAAAAPAQTFALLAEAVTRLVRAPLASDASGRLERGAAALRDLDAAVYLADHVAPRAAERPELAAAGAALLATCLERRSPDPAVLSLLLSLLSALSPLLRLAPQMTAPLLERAFEAAAFPAPAQDRPARELRWHGCNALLSLAARQPAALAAAWPLLAARAQALLAEPDRLASKEGVTLAELLVLVHARLGDYQQQLQLVEQLVAPHVAGWQRLVTVCRSPAALMSTIGLDAPPPPPDAPTAADAERQATRAQLTLLVDLLNGLLLRCRPPADADRLRTGGFLDPATGAARSPCAPAVLPHLPLVFQLVRALSALDGPEQRARLHPQLAAALELSAGRRQALLLTAPERTADAGDGQRSPLERMQGFVSHLYETALTLLSNACTALGPELFAVPRLGDYLAGSVLHGLEHLSDHRLRVQVRGLWRTVVWRCPPELRPSLLHPLLATLFSHLVVRLDTRWLQVQQEASSAADRDDEDTEAVVAEQLLRQVTREAVQLATIVLTVTPTSAAADDDAMEEDAAPPAGADHAVSALGLEALRGSGLAQPLLTLLFKAIGWGDSVAALKATQLSPLVVRALVGADLVDDAAASQLLYWLLHGLETQGHHEANLTSLVSAITVAYVSLRPGHAAAVDQVLCQVPDVTTSMVDDLQQKVLNTPKIALSEKLKKEEVKKLVKPLVSRSMSQLFQKKASILNLPTMTKAKRPQPNASSDVISIADLFGDT